jgi:Zn-finger nucleic acid-binding protein
VCDLAKGHFYRCPACGGWMDGHDLGQVFDHEGPLPHPSDDWRQQDLVAR